jgi:predicted regulator of Ras-like GTPase activity (Roadblock/LC7/MglB family)
VKVVITGEVEDSFREKFKDATNLSIAEGADVDGVVAELNETGVRKGFFGSAIEIELFDYVQMIALTGRDKVIEVATPNDTATLWFEHGDIVHVEYGDFRGEMAFYKVLSESRGAFREVYWRSPPRRTVTRSSTHILMEAARQSDEGTLGVDATPVEEDPETSFADLSIESTRISINEDQAANDSSGPELERVVEGEPKRKKKKKKSSRGKKAQDTAESTPTSEEKPEVAQTPPGRPAGAPPVINQANSGPLRPKASDNEDEDFAALVEDSLTDKIDEEDVAAIQSGEEFGDGQQQEDSMPKGEPAAAMSTAAGHAILDDPDTRAVMLEQFWQFEGINGVAIISSTGKVLAEDMRDNSSLVTLAGFYMRGAARIARALGHNVFDGVVARSVNGQKMVMVGMGAASAVLSVEPEADAEQVRDAVMGVD